MSLSSPLKKKLNKKKKNKKFWRRPYSITRNMKHGQHKVNKVFVLDASASDKNFIPSSFLKTLNRENLFSNAISIVSHEDLKVPLLSSLKKSKKAYLEKFDKLSDLLNAILTISDQENTFIQAVSSKDKVSNFHLSDEDTLSLNMKDRRLSLRLKSSTFKSTPLCYFSRGGFSVMKDNGSKVRHRTDDTFSSGYLIIAGVTPRVSLNRYAKYIITSIFESSIVIVYSHDANLKEIENIFGMTLESSSLTSTCLDPSINLTPVLDDVDSNYSLQDLYEYTILLHLNSSLLSKQPDKYICSYEIPHSIRNLSTITTSGKLHKFLISDVHGFFVETIKSLSWISINVVSDKANLLFLNLENKIILWVYHS